jgi:hypothetical protein
MATRVVASVRLDGEDDETFGSNEFGSGSFRREVVLDAADNPADLIDCEIRFGGEVRIELHLDATLLNSGNVTVDGELLLFEGSRESTTDLDGRRDFTMLIPPQRTLRSTQRVNNDQEGGDTGRARVTISNFPF